MATSVNPKIDLANFIGSIEIFIKSIETFFVEIVILINIRCFL